MGRAFRACGAGFENVWVSAPVTGTLLLCGISGARLQSLFLWLLQLKRDPSDLGMVFLVYGRFSYSSEPVSSFWEQTQPALCGVSWPGLPCPGVGFEPTFSCTTLWIPWLS